MFKKIQQWYEGKNVRVDPDEPDNIGGLRVLHDTEKEYHWSAKIAHRLGSVDISS